MELKKRSEQLPIYQYTATSELVEVLLKTASTLPSPDVVITDVDVISACFHEKGSAADVIDLMAHKNKNTLIDNLENIRMLQNKDVSAVAALVINGQKIFMSTSAFEAIMMAGLTAKSQSRPVNTLDLILQDTKKKNR